MRWRLESDQVVAGVAGEVVSLVEGNREAVADGWEEEKRDLTLLVHLDRRM